VFSTDISRIAALWILLVEQIFVGFVREALALYPGCRVEVRRPEGLAALTRNSASGPREL
jgi:hypothetical protein